MDRLMTVLPVRCLLLLVLFVVLCLPVAVFGTIEAWWNLLSGKRLPFDK